MPIHRSITNFEAVVSDMRAERRQIPITEFRTASGGFDRRAIMKEACRQSRRFRAGMSWQQRVSMCLRGVWEAAKKQGSRPYSPSQAARRASRLFSTEARA